jgi:hypothetical protein
MNDLINKVIQVSAKEEKLQGGKTVMKVKDEKNLVYTVYKTKQDGTESVAWGQIPDIGETVQIGFVEQQGEYEGKAVTYRTIRTFNKDIGNGVANAQTPRQERFANPLYDKPKEFKPRNFDQEAYEKCCSLWASSLLEKPNVTIKDCIALVETGMCWELFQAIKTDGKKRFFEFSGTGGGVSQVFAIDPELPTIQVEDIDVSDIPF